MMATFKMEGNTLIVDGFHIGGGVGEASVTAVELTSLAQQMGRNAGADQIILKNTVRHYGQNRTRRLPDMSIVVRP